VEVIAGEVSGGRREKSQGHDAGTLERVVAWARIPSPTRSSAPCSRARLYRCVSRTAGRRGGRFASCSGGMGLDKSESAEMHRTRGGGFPGV
jgi:hypothetical protein